MISIGATEEAPLRAYARWLDKLAREFPLQVFYKCAGCGCKKGAKHWSRCRYRFRHEKKWVVVRDDRAATIRDAHPITQLLLNEIKYSHEHGRTIFAEVTAPHGMGALTAVALMIQPSFDAQDIIKSPSGLAKWLSSRRAKDGVCIYVGEDHHGIRADNVSNMMAIMRFSNVRGCVFSSELGMGDRFGKLRLIADAFSYDSKGNMTDVRIGVWLRVHDVGYDWFYCGKATIPAWYQRGKRQ